VLRVAAHIPPGPPAPGDITTCRVLLAADLVARTAELHGTQVLTAVVFADAVPEQLTDLERLAGEMGVHPPAARNGLAGAGASLDGPFDLHATAAPDAAGSSESGIVLRCGSVHIDPEEMRAGRYDVLAVRLALLSVPPGEDVVLGATALGNALDGLTNSRREVAHWAESPSKPMPERLVSALRAAFDELDTALAIGLLRDLADDAGIAAGAKFEAFAFADRILGVDLAREIGHSPS